MVIGKVGLAPMAGISNWSFRTLCFKFGAEFAYTEMISAESIVRNLKINEKYFPKDIEKKKGCSTDIWFRAIHNVTSSKYGRWKRRMDRY